VVTQQVLQIVQGIKRGNSRLHQSQPMRLCRVTQRDSDSLHRIALSGFPTWRRYGGSLRKNQHESVLKRDIRCQFVCCWFMLTRKSEPSVDWSRPSSRKSLRDVFLAEKSRKPGRVFRFLLPAAGTPGVANARRQFFNCSSDEDDFGICHMSGPTRLPFRISRCI
jgi:hypothetical protein